MDPCGIAHFATARVARARSSWFVVNALWKGCPRRRSETGSPEPHYPEYERLRVLRSARESGAEVEIVYVAA
jgi:hypothetical protein